jgi:putative ATP-binding cassette transporter
MKQHLSKPGNIQKVAPRWFINIRLAMASLLNALRQIGELALPYFRSQERWAARGLLAAIVAIELATVAISVLINQWYARFYDALQNRDWDVFVHELGVFSVLAGAFVLFAVYQLYLNQWLQIRWRFWMTKALLRDWLEDAVPYRMQLSREHTDNPDQRIADDIQIFVSQTLSLGVGLIGSVVSLSSFVVILWMLSSDAPLTLFGHVIAVPGYLVLTALIYAVIGTFLTHRIGHPLVALNFDQQRYEANFRASLLRVRENAEQIALLRGDAGERRRLIERFGGVVMNWRMIMSRQKKLTSFTASYNQASVVIPFLIASPAYFAGAVQLGALMQTASAFGQVQTSLSFFVSSYSLLAEWKSVIDRLSGFSRAIRDTRSLQPRLARAGGGLDHSLDIRHLTVFRPDGAPLMTVKSSSIRLGERTLIMGPSGAGKSTLFRSLAGIWPYAEGLVDLPDRARVLVLPQRPYLPDGKLRAAIAFPAAAAEFSDARFTEVLVDAGMQGLAHRLDEIRDWQKELSVGEQQRLSIARALLLVPDWLLLDEATSSLDEAAEREIYRTLCKNLPQTAILSIGHRSTLRAFHDRILVVDPVAGVKFENGHSSSPDSFTLTEGAVKTRP